MLFIIVVYLVCSSIVHVYQHIPRIQLAGDDNSVEWGSGSMVTSVYLVFTS